MPAIVGDHTAVGLRGCIDDRCDIVEIIVDACADDAAR
jgi:hypothetical protein